MNLKADLGTAIKSGVALDELLGILHNYKACGGTQDGAYAVLEVIREAEKKDDVIEDKILEVMDFVTGFCSKDKRIWE